MKIRILAAICCAALLLSACGGAIPQTETAEAPETEKATETVSPVETEEIRISYPKISQPVTRADLEKIPVATPDMTQDELRKICVDYMALMTGVVWTPDETVAYAYPSAGAADAAGDLHLVTGNRYGGVPYTKAAANLECFFDYYDEATGVVAISKVKTAISDKFGNNCGTAVFWAWQRVSSTIDYFGTRQMCLAHGCVPVGTWTYDESLPDFYEYTTTRVCEENGEKVMYESYACFKPGDGMTMLHRNADGEVSGGHARMVAEVHVVKKADGSVDPAQSYVICLEQGSKGNDRNTEDGKVVGISGYYRQYSFETLYQTGYLPVTVAELCGKSQVQKGAVTFTPSEDSNPVKAFLNATVQGNFCISRSDVTFQNAAGETVYSGGQTGSCNPSEQYVMKMSKILSAGSLTRNLKKGETYQVTVTARLGNGETLTAWEGELLYQP